MSKNTGEASMKCLHRVMKHLVETQECCLFMKPKELQDGDLDFEFAIEGSHDYGYSTKSLTGKVICGHVTELNRIPVVIESGKIKKAYL